ncbi:hypothetical protein LTS08_007960 [Lithohypha guttulata]|nr:hypothetical protein LTS08_007960 [Lithohypha guttulata]
MPIRLLIVAGGQSAEHHVSLSSAKNVLEGLSESDIFVTTIIVTKDGRWLSPEASLQVLRRGVGAAECDGDYLSTLISCRNEYDVVFPLIHGPTGEDGILQGFLQMLNLPYIGCGVLASAICMDKVIFRDIAKARDLPQVKYLSFRRSDFNKDKQHFCDKVKLELASPWIVKPSALGSSIGVAKVEEADGDARLKETFHQAFQYGAELLVEECVPNLCELEVAVVGNETSRASVLGRIVYEAYTQDHETKYGDTTLQIPADVPVHIAERCRSVALKAYRCYGCTGLARVDFFYDSVQQHIVLNEINTLPGFTDVSMFPRLWEYEGRLRVPRPEEQKERKVNSASPQTPSQTHQPLCPLSQPYSACQSNFDFASTTLSLSIVMCM